jgi:3-hydroxyacyl-[acyl-carrier-protein] dehydratase
MKELYEITSGRENGVFEVRLNPVHAIFDGHFPGNPVLPGVCSMMIVRECASRTVGQPLRSASIRESKFLAAITPDPILSVKLKLSTQDHGYSLDATICLGETTMLKLKAHLIPDE